MLQKLKWKAEKIFSHNPYLYFYTKKILKYFPLALPHDRDFHAFKYIWNNGNSIFLDVGANDGISARSFRRLNKSFKILSIEPNPFQVESLESFKKSDSNFDYHLIGAGEQSLELDLYTPIYKGRIPIHSAASSDAFALKKNVELVYPERIHKHMIYEKTRIQVKPLDDLNLKPALIKIDTEGFDYFVLRGLKKTIMEHRPSIMVEAHGPSQERIISFFNEINYEALHFIQDRETFTSAIPKTAKNIFGVCRDYLKRNPIPRG